MVMIHTLECPELIKWLMEKVPYIGSTSTSFCHKKVGDLAVCTRTKHTSRLHVQHRYMPLKAKEIGVHDKILPWKVWVDES